MKNHRMIRPRCLWKAAVCLSLISGPLPVSGQALPASPGRQAEKASFGKARGRGEAAAFAADVRRLATKQRMSEGSPPRGAALHQAEIGELMKEDASFRISSRRLLANALNGNTKTNQECEIICRVSKALARTCKHEDLTFLHGIYINVGKAETLQEVRLLRDLCGDMHAALIGAGLVPESSFKRSRVYKQLMRREWSLSQSR